MKTARAPALTERSISSFICSGFPWHWESQVFKRPPPSRYRGPEIDPAGVGRTGQGGQAAVGRLVEICMMRSSV